MLLQGDRLTLMAKAHEMGENHQRRLVWERVSPLLDWLRILQPSLLAVLSANRK